MIKNMVRTQIQRAKEISRDTAVIPNNQKRIPFVVSYHPELPNIGKILGDLHPLLRSSEMCRDIVKEFSGYGF